MRHQKSVHHLWLIPILVATVPCSSAFGATPIVSRQWEPLSGEWRFALDPNNQGLTEQWHGRQLEDWVRLPGTTDENQKGERNDRREAGRLTRLYPYYGPAWYQRDVDVPAAWQGKRIVLYLERTKSTQLWVDGKNMGQQNSLVAPHQYDLGSPAPGRHRLTLRIGNNEYPRIGDPHQISDQTQTNWNGVVGKIGLCVTDLVWIEDAQVYPNVATKSVHVRVEVGNVTGKTVDGMVTFIAVANQGHAAPVHSQSFSARDRNTVVETTYALGEEALPWDEFSPTVYRLTVSLKGLAGESSLNDCQEVAFGLREFRSENGAFRINSRTVFLRGTHDACVFPLTGYPPMTVAGWLRVFTMAKSYGLNAFRFHTWCPPEAAFEAADLVGIYLQPELPNWTDFGRPEHDDFERAEGERILRAFGNHPSFISLALGNELGGRQDVMTPFVAHFKSLDCRHLYAQGSNNWFPKVPEGDDYWTSFQAQGRKIRGSYACVDRPLGHIQTGPASTDKDYSAQIAGWPVPIVSFEVGQYQISPDLRETERYTGVVRARNLEIYRDRLKEKGMVDQAHDFFRASGALSVLCYREEFEAALRTPGFDGISLLDLKDFPGQGTALVGILNAFMESKGLVEPAQWRQFCCETVPLIRMAKYTWTQGETFAGKAQVAHYGPSDLQTTPIWTLRDSQGQTLASGRLPGLCIAQGTVTSLGDLQIPLKSALAPAKLELELALDGTPYKNVYSIWVYPDRVDTNPGKVVVSRTLDDGTRQSLQNGATVLLIPDLNSLTKSLEGMWSCDFWNYGMFNRMARQRNTKPAPGTLGILCDPNHPALSRFPTEFHSNWQWFNLIQNSRTVILDAMPVGYRPLVQVIDTFERCDKLAVVFEVAVGPGRLLVCAIDLPALQDEPEARQLSHSLLHYMNSEAFAPATSVDAALLGTMLK